MLHESVACFFIMLLLANVPEVVGQIFPAVIVFGDSTVDAGNNNQIPTLIRSNFRPYGRDFEGGKPTGRFCNGRLVTDFISEGLGIKPLIPAYLDPEFGIEDFATGVTFASAGSGYDNLTVERQSVIPLWRELEYYKEYQMELTSFLGEDKATTTLREALYILSIGTNDFLLNYFPVPLRSLQFTVDEYSDILIEIAREFITGLFELGARKISIVGLPSMGCLPISRVTNLFFGSACREDYNKVARDFNVKLQNLLANLRGELQGIKLVYIDIYVPLLQVNEKPHLYGFEEVVQGCCATGTFEYGYLCNELNPLTCTDDSKYVYWDGIHPSEKVYHILADKLLKTILAEFI